MNWGSQGGDREETQNRPLSPYKCILAMFGAEDAGILAVNGEDNKSEAALAKAEALGKGL